jgi:hypothetical protein
MELAATTLLNIVMIAPTAVAVTIIKVVPNTARAFNIRTVRGM